MEIAFFICSDEKNSIIIKMMFKCIKDTFNNILLDKEIKMNEDLRVQKTKKAIHDAFFELLQEEPFEKITINQISQRAMIGKGTFYYHYTDKYDLAEKLIQEYISAYQQSLKERLSLNKSDRESVQQLVNSINHVADELLILCKIRTSEINVEKMIKEGLSEALLPIIEKNTSDGNSKNVSKLMAAVLMEILVEHKESKQAITLEYVQTLLKDLSQALKIFI